MATKEAQLADHELAWYAAVGVSVGLMLFSSPSSRKYIPLVFAAIIFSQRQALWEPEFTINWDRFYASPLELGLIALSGLFLLAALTTSFSYRRLVTKLYPKLMGSRFTHPAGVTADSRADHIVSSTNGLVVRMLAAGFVITAYLTVSRLLVHDNSFYWSHLLLVGGLGGLIVLLTFPDVTGNLWAYYKHSQQHLSGRFPIYREYFASIGRPINDDMRGGGFVWIVRFFGRLTPVHLALFLASIVLLAVLLAIDSSASTKIWQGAAILALGLSPPLVGEITRGPQHGRSYFPGLLGLILFVAYVTFQLDRELDSVWRAVVWSVGGAAALGSGVWAFWVYVDDVLPARMAVSKLRRSLRDLNITEFYTYDTTFNNAFVAALPEEDLKRYKINYVNCLKEATNGYIVVPGTSAKALNMEGVGWAIEHGDFDLDSDLDRLIKSKEIEDYSVASFKTFGTSRIWVHEAPVPSYRDLILNEISDDDRWRGRAWILNLAKLNAAQQSS